MEIHLDGGETTIIKALGVFGTHIDGETLMEKIGAWEPAELLDTLKGLISAGYVNCDKRSLHSIEDIERTNFHVNTGYSRDLKEALEPRHKRAEKPSRRVRRE